MAAGEVDPLHRPPVGSASLGAGPAGSAAGGAPHHRLDWSAGAFVAPALVFAFLFYLLPNLLNTAVAFTSWSTLAPQIRFIGIDNFATLAFKEIAPAVWLTFRFAIVAMIAQNLVALVLALALERSTPLNGFLRAVFFVPVLISTLATGYIWRAILDPDGLLNQSINVIAVPLGLGAIDTAWLGSQDGTIYVVALVHAWKWFGLAMLIYIAGLKAIPHDLVEAARIDGASAGQVIRRIKLPLLAPAFTFNLTLSLIGALSSFDVIVAMTKGGPGRATEVFNLLVWRQFGQGQFAYAATIALVLVLVVAVCALPLLVYLRRREVSL